MSSKKKNEMCPDADTEAAESKIESSGTEKPEELPAEDECSCNEEADTLSAEVAELKIKLNQAVNDKLIVMADFENYRKRTLKEKADLIKSGGEECLKNLLPVIDDFERSLAAINESNDVDAIKEGVNHIYSKFKNYLSQQGIKEIETKDADFDTEYHEAVTTFAVQDPQMKGKVIDCMQKGYIMNGKVIRFAKVVVGE
ncbi:MAG: nucleotide exchange factor GrpE [Bacteroidales bacterium]